MTSSRHRVLLAAAAIFVSLTLWANPASAQRPQSIAAIVNDDVISLHDLDARINLLLATSNLQNTPETRSRLAPEVLRTLIDDTLKRQEMRRQNIVVGQADIDRALTQIAVQLQIPSADLPGHLAQRGVAMSTLIDQLEAEIGWQRAVARTIADRANVGAEEVDEEIGRTRRDAGAVEYRIAEIFLSVDDPADQPRVEDLARRLVADARAGANFPSLARTFSQGPSADAGGDLGWTPRDELDPQIEAVVSQLQPGQISDPIRGTGGYFILALVGRRSGDAALAGSTTVTLQQMFLPVPRDATETLAATQARSARDIGRAAQSCSDFEQRGREAGAMLPGMLGPVDLLQLPPEMRQLVQPLTAGQATPPVRMADGFLVLMVCERRDETSGDALRTQVERRLRDQRLANASRRQLRDLRRAALLDIRL